MSCVHCIGSSVTSPCQEWGVDSMVLPLQSGQHKQHLGATAQVGSNHTHAQHSNRSNTAWTSVVSLLSDEQLIHKQFAGIKGQMIVMPVPYESTYLFIQLGLQRLHFQHKVVCIGCRQIHRAHDSF